MDHLINKRLLDIQISGIRKFANLVSNYNDAVSLTIGQPDFATPAHIRDAAKIAIDQNKTTYTHNAGLIELRKAASDFLQKKYGMSYNPEDEIIVTNGASEAIDITFRTILEEGCEVILPGPIFPGYEPIIKLCGATPVFIDTTETNFKLTAEQLKDKITDKTRCILIPYPSNPTGHILNQQNLIEIANLIKDKEIFIVSDELYSELIYGETHHSIASIADVREKTIVINGLSKSHSMTGWRIGFTFAPAYITQHMLKVHQYNTTCASSISQYAALEALTRGIDDAEPMRIEYQKRRDYIYERLVSMGFDVEKPDGAFYIFPSIKKFNMKSFDFATELLKHSKVAVVPGDAFSKCGEGYVRISYAYSMDVLEKGLDRMQSFIESL
jgi:aminotransferase